MEVASKLTDAMESLSLTVENIPELLQSVDPTEEPRDIEEVLYIGLYHQIVLNDVKSALQYYQSVYNNHPYDIRSYILVYGCKDFLDIQLETREGLYRKLRSRPYDFKKYLEYFESLNFPQNAQYWYILAVAYKIYGCHNRVSKIAYSEMVRKALIYINMAIKFDCHHQTGCAIPFQYTRGTLYEMKRAFNESKLEFESIIKQSNTAKAYYALGMLLAKEFKHYNRALQLFHTGLKYHPDFYVFHLAIGNLYHTNLKDITLALKHYNICIEHDPECMEVQYSLGVLNEDHFKNYDAAKEHYLKSIECIESQYALGLLCQKIGEYENAKKYFSMMLENSTSTSILKKANYNMALLYEENFKDFEKARIHYENCLEFVSNDKNIRYALGLLYQNCLHDPEKALYHYKKIAKNNAKANYAMGVLYQNYFKDYDRARIHYLRAIEYKPNYADVYYAMGYLEQDIYQNPGNALLYYEKAIKVDDQYHEAHYAMGLIYQDLDQYEDAREAYRRVLAIKNTHVSAQLALGLLLSDSLQQHDEAREHYDKGITLVAHADLHYAYGLLLQNHFKDFEEAREQFQICLNLESDHIDSLYALGLLLKTQFYDYEGARTCYEQTIAINFNYVRAHQALGILLKNHFGDFEGAKKCYETALSIDPNRSNVHYALGILLYVHYRDYNTALHHFVFAMEIEPSDYSCFRYIERIMIQPEFQIVKWDSWRSAMKHISTREDFNSNYVALDVDELHYTWLRTPKCFQLRARYLYHNEVDQIQATIANRLPAVHACLKNYLLADLKNIVVETLVGKTDC